MNKDTSELKQLINNCIRRHRASQKELYRRYYSYGLTVCLHYARNREEAEEILNDGFLKAFNKIHQYSHRSAFKSWLRKILIRSAIDYYRKYHLRSDRLDLDELPSTSEVENEAIHNLSMDDALALLQKLTPAYRMVFNLFVLEEYTHPEIAKMLNISVGTSKSNLSKARKKLKELALPYFHSDDNISNS